MRKGDNGFSACGKFLYARTARIRQTEHARDFIERLSARVVLRGAEQFHFVISFCKGDCRMSAAGYKAHERRLQFGRSDIVDGYVSAYVVDRVKRLV